MAQVRAQTKPQTWIARRQGENLAIFDAAGQGGVVPASPASLRFSIQRAAPLPRMTGRVVEAERAARAGMGAHLVGAERELASAIGHIVVGVVGRQRGTRWKMAAVGTARRALPLAIVTQPC